MRVLLTYFIGALIGLCIQASLIHTSSPAAVAPDFILILTVAIALFHHSAGGVLGAFLLGLLADFASAEYVGPNAAGCIVAFCLVGLIANRVYADKVVAVFIITFVCSLAKSLVSLLIYEFYLDNFSFPPDVVRIMGFEALLSACFAPLVFRLLRSRVRYAAPVSKMQGAPVLRWTT